MNDIDSCLMDFTTIAGLGIANGVASKCIQNMRKSFSVLEREDMNVAIDEFYKSTELDKKNVKIVDVSDEAIKYDEEVKKLREKKNVRKAMKDVKVGKNAFYNFKHNAVFINRKEMPMYAFHELGHAFNRNNSFALRACQSTGTCGMVLSIASCILPLLLTKTKEVEGHPLTSDEKTSNFLCDASPYMAAGFMLPSVVEEGVASLKANKFAKPLLNASTLRKVNKANALGFVTYLTGLVALTVGAHLANKMHDV